MSLISNTEIATSPVHVQPRSVNIV